MNIRLILSFALALFGMSTAFGKLIDCETAIARYETYTGKIGHTHELLKTYTDEDNQPASYVVTYDENGGFIILPADDSVSPKDAIEFYEQTAAKDKSLFIYAGVNHFLMIDIKGHEIAGDVLNWIEDRLGNTVYEEFEF